MKKESSNNSFAEGLMMDFNPLVTPNTVMTNCLNGTLITFNGNEYILLNDMGNGRVETAYLPEGYIPMGTCELGGIIYIVSYNPNKNTCQIGSFPSPERNITSDETHSTEVVLSNSDFQWDENLGARIYYLKKDLDSSLKFFPGDKFIVYGSNIEVNGDKLYELTTPEKSTLKLSLGTVTDDGRLVIFDTSSLKTYSISNLNAKYHIKEYSKNESESIEFDEYRTLTSLPYNIFSSKISGTLVLIAELVQFDSFSTRINHVFDDSKMYSPILTMDFSGSYIYVPYGIQKHFELIGEDTNSIDEDVLFNITEQSTEYSIEEPLLSEDIILKILTVIGENYFSLSSENRKKYILNYKITPCMNWGPVKHLASEGSIALHNIGSGIIELTAWKYYNSETKCNLTWGLGVYEEEGKSILNVKMTFTRLLNNSGGREVLEYQINLKSSYHGTFYELIPFGQSYYKLNLKTLYPDQLYLTTITVTYGNDESSEDRTFYRWLYTNTVFNNYYTTETDFKNLTLKFNTKINLNFEDKSIKSSLDKYLGSIKEEKTSEEYIEPIKSLSVLRNKTTRRISGLAKVLFENDYNIFRLGLNSQTLNIEHLNIATLSIVSKNKYIDQEDGNIDTYLENEIYTDWDGKIKPFPSYLDPESSFIGPDAIYQNGVNILSVLNADPLGENKSIGDPIEETVPEIVNPLPGEGGSGNDNSEGDSNEDEELNGDLNLELNPELEKEIYDLENFIVVYKDDSFQFTISYLLVNLAKAYSILTSTLCSSNGKIIPLAYDATTFSDYNLELSNTHFKPILLGTFGFFEQGGVKGHCFIGYARPESSDFKDFEFSTANNVNFNWTGDSEILEAELKAGWHSSIVFAAHHCSSKSNEQYQRWLDTSKRNVTGSNGVSGSSTILSKDSAKFNDTNIIHILLKSNTDNYYYPINCARVANANKNIKNYYTNENWTAFYTHIAQVLNNLFRYVPESEMLYYWIPGSIQYGDDYVYTINIPITYTLNKTNGKVNASALLKLSDDSYVDLSENFIKMFLVDQNIPEELRKNISYEINDNISDGQYSITSTIRDKSSGPALRDIFLSNTGTSLGTSICGYNGKPTGNYVSNNFNQRYIYCKNKDGEVNEASSFSPVTLKYSTSKDGAISVKEGFSKLYKNDVTYNISKYYTLDDKGMLILKDPSKSDLTLLRYGEHDTGYVYGYLLRGLSPDYEFWRR